MSAICDAHKKVEKLYNTVHRKFNQLEIRRVGEKMLDWGTCPREAGHPGPRLSSPVERERNAVMANRVGVNMLRLCSVSNSLSHTTLSIMWAVYFSKELCRSSSLFRRYDYARICVCIFGHGYTTIVFWLFIWTHVIVWNIWTQIFHKFSVFDRKKLKINKQV